MITLHFHLGPQYKYELFHTNFTVMSVSLVNILHSSTPILTPSTNTSNLQKKKKTDLSHFWTRQPGTKKSNVYRKATHTENTFNLTLTSFTTQTLSSQNTKDQWLHGPIYKKLSKNHSTYKPQRFCFFAVHSTNFRKNCKNSTIQYQCSP